MTDQYIDPAIGNRAHRKALERGRYADLIDSASSTVALDRGFVWVCLAEKRQLLKEMSEGVEALRRQA